MAGGEETFAEITSYDTKLFGIPVQVFGSPGLADAWRTEGLPRRAWRWVR